jgi:uncharacterized coiled-coil protein SlyX
MSDEFPFAPDPTEPHRKAIPPRVWGPFVLALFVVLLSAAVYGYREHNMVRQLGVEKSEMMASLDATRGQLAVLTNRLNDLTAQPSSGKPAPSRPDKHRATVRGAASVHRRAEDPRWKEIQSQLAEQQKQIEANRQDLGSTRTELQGSIARTHDELVVLERKGERAYYEFDLDKSSQFQRKGPVGISLHKSNTKHQNADLELMVDDVKLSKKHVNLYEPVFFYSADNKQPAELVINSISKNHIHGYVDEPKYRAAELEAMANSSGNLGSGTTSNGTNAQQPRQRLETPKN